MKVKNVEKKIWNIEGFDVQIKHSNGKDVHGAKEGLPSYPYENALKNGATVSDWKKSRFAKSYPGYEVSVYDGDGEEVTAGNTQLGSVRDTYSEEG